MRSQAEENAAFLRAERRNRILVEVAVAAALAVFLYFNFRHPADPLHNSNAVTECRSDYTKARSARDTAIVDRRAPLPDPEGLDRRVTCGDLRRFGRLR